MQQVVSVQGVTPAAATVINEKAFLGRFNVLNQETVGPRVGKELQQKAFWAIVLSSLAMAIYIAFRFEGGLVFGAASLVSIIHDVHLLTTTQARHDVRQPFLREPQDGPREILAPRGMDPTRAKYQVTATRRANGLLPG